MIAGISTLGARFGYGVETSAGTKPTSFNELSRINNIGGLNISNETIDASSITDTIDRFIRGRGSTGGTLPVSWNVTDETIVEWEELLEAYDTAAKSDLRMWFEVDIPGIEKGYFFVAQPPTALPMPEIGQNQLLVAESTLTVEEYIGPSEKVAISGEA